MLRDQAPKAATKTTRRARQLRQTMTLPEVLLWQALRRRPHGLKFRRQHPSGAFVLDFYCNDARLGIEVDGATHDGSIAAERDDRRDRWFAAAGIATLRIPARIILADPDEAATAIVAHCRSRLPLHHPAAPDGPPPRAELGEDQDG